MARQYLPATWDQSSKLGLNHVCLDNLLKTGLPASHTGINVQLHSTPLAVSTSEKANMVTSREGLFNISSITSPVGSLATDEGYSSMSTPISLPRERQPVGISHRLTEGDVFPNGCGGDSFNRQKYHPPPRLPAYTTQQAVYHPGDSAFMQDLLSSRYLDWQAFLNANNLNASLAGANMYSRRNSAFVEPAKAGINDYFRNFIPFNENRSPYQQAFAQIRQEMIQLIELGIHHLEGYLKGGPQRHLDNDISQINLSNPTASLILKSDNPPTTTLPNAAGLIQENNQPVLPTGTWRSVSATSNTPLLSNEKPIHVTTSAVPLTSANKSPRDKQIKSPQKLMTKRRRRMRIRTAGYRSRLGQAIRDRLPTSGPVAHIRLPLSPIRNVPDGGLDLRVRTDRIRTQMPVEESMDTYANKTKYTNLTASHLKRAKIMFMYARYPSSSLLKAHFPDVTFTRATTAQVVKWFSNFREFFYMHIEKYVRQYITQVATLKEDIVLTRSHELFSTLEKHYNKDNEIESPKEFIQVTEVALREFLRAITSHRDQDPGWKREIYRNVVPYDCPFPHFVKDIN